MARREVSERLVPAGEVLPPVPRPRRRRGAGEAVRALIELVTGQPVPSVEEDPHWQPPAVTITAPLMAQLTFEGLATLRQLAVEHLNARAAMYLVDRGLGSVGESFEEKTRRYPLDQARAELAQTLAGLGLTPDQVDGFVARALAPAREGDG